MPCLAITVRLWPADSVSEKYGKPAQIVAEGAVRSILTGCTVKNVLRFNMDTKPLSRERIIWHLSVPVCEILSGVRTHVQFMSLLEQWKMCYSLRCGSI